MRIVFLALMLAPGLSLAQGTDMDPLADWGLRATEGAAAGYVDDSACAECHSDKADSFRDVGMARSFYAPDPASPVEDFSALPYYHAPSDRYYQVEIKDNAYWFTRYRLTPGGARTEVFEHRINWILGSGNHSRIYLYQTPDGSLFQLPLSWYSQSGKWAMAPGYEHAGHLGVKRQVEERCMSCHNAFAEVPKGSDRPGMNALFPTELPQGIGCQRCHGPGAAHVRSALSGQEEQTVRAAIVNPGTLPNEQLYGICYGCHMQPTVSVNAGLRLGRGAYSFRPGQDLQDYLFHLDIEDQVRAKEDRFEINHHPYRLEQSACFVESQGQLGCLNCHDPHVKIAPQDRAAHYRAACLQCHELDDKGLPILQAAGARHPEISATDDCTTCHMPERRTQDVIEVTMTDHKITRVPPVPDPLARLPKAQAEVHGVYPLRQYDDIESSERLFQQVRAILQHKNGKDVHAASRLAQEMSRQPSPHYEPWMELARSSLALNQPDFALRAAREAHARAPDVDSVVLYLARAMEQTGDRDGATQVLRDHLLQSPLQVSLLSNLATMLYREGEITQAALVARRGLDLRPNDVSLLLLLAAIHGKQGAPDKAIDALERALAVDPMLDDVREALARLLATAGQVQRAEILREMALDPQD